MLPPVFEVGCVAGCWIRMLLFVVVDPPLLVWKMMPLNARSQIKNPTNARIIRTINAVAGPSGSTSSRTTVVVLSA